MRSRHGTKRKTGTKHKGIDLSMCSAFGKRWTQSRLRSRIKGGISGSNYTKPGKNTRYRSKLNAFFGFISRAFR